MTSGTVDVFAGVEHEVPSMLREALTGLELVDHHVHGTYADDITRNVFEQSINEGSPDPVPAFMSMFDSQLGFAIRRWVAPLLGLAPHASADQYWTRRASMSSQELDSLLLPAARVTGWIVDESIGLDALRSPGDLASASGADSNRLVRLERLAESVAAECADPAEFVDRVRAAVAAESADAAGFKSIAAYRCGLDIDWSRPSDDAVTAAVSAWLRTTPADRLRTVDPVIIAFLVHSAVDRGRPLQLHIGLGDRDLDLDRTNPLHLLPLLRSTAESGSAVMLLHCWPFHREAGYLAQAFDHVHFDIGLAINFVGAQSAQVVRESFEVAPFAKQLYSSDAYGLPELHLLGSVLWRRSMGLALGEWVRRGDWSADDAVRVAQMIGAENARRVYTLR
ncbi:amidohydrolase family protein [Aeromicrobium endophyticum]|uniref:Amidohydrolase n=1 Tax=Aeromicrobium endophyticum TaxID=2292704 RepID=A0A371P5A8_9ACTN|nr:amidohydrolase family protein [Aeromicrobium endophyticum]REK71133.1 amidohydrolase [Aeromicrobium endophyticum]